MGITQADIDALLTAAEDVGADVGTSGPESAMPAATAASAPPTSIAAGREAGPDPPAGDLNRILHLKVPVIVKLAEQKMPLERVLGVNVGVIIEFEHAFDAELDLIVGNCRIATGQAVKVGENFGLRITNIGKLDDTIRALSGAS
ncbi:MAG: FliM/FliN family flagellar motor switch protein [bacterium]|nr:FliM/FliN family flagellar motor switch protein [bacterium]